MLFIDSFFELFFERDIEFWRKIIISQKWRWWRHWASFRTSNFQPPDPCAHFIFTLQKVSPLRSTARAKTSEFSVTFGRFGAFPDLWRHTQREFLSVSLDLAYRSNETFCSRTHRFGCGPETLVCWKGRKVHRNGGYPAAHFEFCRSSVTPSGPPSALTSSTGGVVAGHRCCCCRCWWWGLFVWMGGVHNITEILNIPSSIDSNSLLKFHLACFSCFRTAQTTANNRHVFRVDKLPDRPPRFHSPPPLFTQSLIDLSRKLHFCFF